MRKILYTLILLIFFSTSYFSYKIISDQYDKQNSFILKIKELVPNKLKNDLRNCPIKSLYSNYKKLNMDVLLLLSKKNNTFGYNGKGDYSKLDYSNASRLTAKSNKVSQKYIFTGWQIINKRILNNFAEKTFSLKKVYDLAERNGRLYGVVHIGDFFHIGDTKSYGIINTLYKL